MLHSSTAPFSLSTLLLIPFIYYNRLSTLYTCYISLVLLLPPREHSGSFISLSGCSGLLAGDHSSCCSLTVSLSLVCLPVPYPTTHLLSTLTLPLPSSHTCMGFLISGRAFGFPFLLCLPQSPLPLPQFPHPHPIPNSHGKKTFPTPILHTPQACTHSDGQVSGILRLWFGTIPFFLHPQATFPLIWAT